MRLYLGGREYPRPPSLVDAQPLESASRRGFKAGSRPNVRACNFLPRLSSWALRLNKRAPSTGPRWIDSESLGLGNNERTPKNIRPYAQLKRQPNKLGTKHSGRMKQR